MNRPYTGGRTDISVVIPANNEEANIGPLLEQFGELARRVRFAFEVIVVDDGSTDRTLARLVDAQRVYRFLRVISIPFRRGLTEALQAGFGIAQGGIIVFYPADRQFHPNDIPRMVDKVRDGYDLVTGRKIGVYNKRVVSSIYSRVSRWLFPSIRATDLNSVKAFRRELIEVFDYRHDWHRFWVAIVAEQGYRVAEVDVTLYPRPAGRSKFGFWRIPSGVLDLLAVKFQYHTMRRPLWYFGLTGSLLLASAFIIGLWALYERIFLSHGYRPLLYLVMTLGISGVVFFTLGFLAESVAGIRQQIDLLRTRPKFRLYHPAPPGSTAAQIMAAPPEDAPPSRVEREQRSAPPERRTSGREGSRGPRPPDRRGDPRRRRGPEQRDSRPPAPRPTSPERVPQPPSVDPPVPEPESPIAIASSSTQSHRLIEDDLPAETSRDLERAASPVEEDHPVDPAPISRRVLIPDEPPPERHPEPQPEPEPEPEQARDVQRMTPVSETQSPATVLAPLEKRPQYGRRNRP